MSTMSAASNDSPEQSGPIRAQRHDTDNLKLTEDETRVLQECRRESFFYRCVPLGVLAITINNVMAKSGYITPHPRFGLIPRNFGGIFLAYVVGKVSYNKKCREKIMKLENSPLADGLRRGASLEQLRIERMKMLNQESNPAEQTIPAQTKLPQGDDYGASSDIDSDKNVQIKGLDDSERPNLDGPIGKLPERSEDVKPNTSYNDLRQVNRAQYEPKVPYSAPQRSAPTISPGPDANVRRNQYGDIIEE